MKITISPQGGNTYKPFDHRQAALALKAPDCALF